MGNHAHLAKQAGARTGCAVEKSVVFFFSMFLFWAKGHLAVLGWYRCPALAKRLAPFGRLNPFLGTI